MLSRKELLRSACRALYAGACAPFLLTHDDACTIMAAQPDSPFIKPARHWKKLAGGSVRCQLCPNECVISAGSRGACRVRMNLRGGLYTLVYGRLAAMHVDPIEKKPLYHVLPGSLAYSVATAGCNMWCTFCQNWQISQAAPEAIDATFVPPGQLSANARSKRCPVIAYTYNEPSVQFEYLVDSARVARSRGIRPVIISNGYINDAPGRELLGVLDAVKIDLKAFTNSFYAKVCGGDLHNVLKTLERIKRNGTWLEIVVLVIPTLNDAPGEIREMTRWVRANLSPDVPMHFTRFHAMYRITNLPPTPVATLERCRTIAREEGIRYPYVGNVPGHRWENTYCHSCGKQIIRRSGFYHVTSSIRNGACPHCATRIPGVWA